VSGEPSVPGQLRDVTKEQVSPTTELSARQGDNPLDAAKSPTDRQPNVNDVERSVRYGDEPAVAKKRLEKQIDT
jgi:hypothetical protein